jgi:hypothetical protein
MRSLTRALLMVLLVGVCVLQAGDRRIWLWYPSAFVSDQETVTYRVRIPRNEDNRSVALVATDGESIVRESDQQLSEQGPAICDFAWRLPAGEYALIAVLYGSQGEIARDSRPLTVRSKLDP